MSVRRSGTGTLGRAPHILTAPLVATVLTAAMAGLLAGCAGIGLPPASVALSEQQGFPADAPIADPFDDPNWAGQPVGWLAEDRATLTIVSYGSSSCPLVATAIDVFDDTILEIELRPTPAQACTADLAPRTHVLPVPGGWGRGNGPYVAEVARVLDAFGTSDPYTVGVTIWPWHEGSPGAGETKALETIRGIPDNITLPDDAFDLGEPLAFWGPDRASLRVVTWGSSSCPPPALSLDVMSATELALVFGALPPQACTADFAPTTHVLAVPLGLDSGAVTLSITIEQADGASQQYDLPIAD